MGFGRGSRVSQGLWVLQGYDREFTAAGEYDIDYTSIDIDMASECVVAPSFSIQDGDFYGGTKLTLGGSVDWRPNSRWYLGAEYEYNEVELPGGDFTTRLIQLRANVAFNVRWSWVNLLQYDYVSNTVGLNSRLRFNPRAARTSTSSLITAPMRRRVSPD